LAEKQDRCAFEWPNSVYIRWTPDIGHALQDGMCGMGLVDNGPCSFASVVAVVAYPGLSKDNFAKTVFPSRHVALEIVFGVLVFFISVVKGVGSRSKANYRFASHEVVIDVAHLLGRELAEPRGDEHQVGIFQVMEAWDVGLLVRIDFSALRIEGKQHGTSKPETRCQDLCQHGKRFFRAVLLISADQYNVFAF